jgi:glycine/D-amino acid oxidase-like deaminating enzyme
LAQAGFFMPDERRRAMELTEHRNLRGGVSNWTADDTHRIASDPIPDHADVAIIGAGVMGAMVAERLASDGRRVAMFDRRPPAHGSTAASTALVMWSADVPLIHLAERWGPDEAARRWRRTYAAVRALAERIDALGIDCARIDRPELYLAGTLLDEAALRAEGAARRAADLPSDYIDGGAVAARFGIAPRAALLSGGSYEVDPVRLTLAMIDRARANGATISFPADVIGIDRSDSVVTLRLTDGVTVTAAAVIIAGGYERARWFLPADFTVGSSYAIASPAGIAPLWGENAMIWEASDPYLYARTSADGRIIAGGEDEDFDDAHQRDALIGTKAGTIQAKLAAMIAEPDVAVECAWAAAFGASPDGLPAIGQVDDDPRIWLASGFGGNGVTFAALGAEIIGAALAGVPDPDAGCFDPYRFRPTA